MITSRTPRFNNALKAWYFILESIVEHGRGIAPRGKHTTEVLNQSVRLPLETCAFTHPARMLNHRFQQAEALWMIAGMRNLKFLTNYNPLMAKFSDDGETLAGAYGPRLQPQWDYIVATLRHDWSTRQAVASIWTPSPEVSKDIPCTLSMQFLRRPENTLNVVVTMRSSDAWLGVPYDIYSFSQIAMAVANEMGLEHGELVLNMASSHLYEDNLDVSKVILATQDHGDFKRPQSAPALHVPPDVVRAGWDPDLKAPLYDWTNFMKPLRVRTSREAWGQM